MKPIGNLPAAVESYELLDECIDLLGDWMTNESNTETLRDRTCAFLGKILAIESKYPMKAGIIRKEKK